MRTEIKHRILLTCAYLYLFLGYACILYEFSYYVRTTSKPIGWMILNLETLALYLIYVAINDIIVKKVISTKILHVAEALLFISWVSVLWSDIMFVNRWTSDQDLEGKKHAQICIRQLWSQFKAKNFIWHYE